MSIGAKEHVSDAIFRRNHLQFILMPVDARPAMRALVRFAMRSGAVNVWTCASAVRRRLVHPPRLRHAHAARVFVTFGQLQKWNLVRERKLLLELVVASLSPRSQTAG